MGRVYEAMKRAADQDNRDAGNKVAAEEAAGGDGGNGRHHHHHHGQPTVGGVTPPAERLFEHSQFFRSASDGHTGNFVSSALPDQDSRAAGATSDAVGAARAVEFDALEISAARVEPHLVAVTQPHAPQTELYRSLRTRLIHAGERRRMQTFVITSAGPAEGKTLTALNLAWLLAQTDGVHALLIEGDLRRPCMSDYLGINGAIGLADVLAGEVPLSDAIVKLQPAGLHLLPGGSPRENVAEILSGNKFNKTLTEARQMFNYIIIDAPPLGIFTDASVMMNRADGALLVVKAGQTRYADLNNLLAPLPHERILGVVLNGAEKSAEDATYYQQYYQRAASETKTAPAAVNEELPAS